MATITYNPDTAYELVHLSDGCHGIRDVSTGLVAHGFGREEFDDFRNGTEWEFSEESVNVAVETLHTPRPTIYVAQAAHGTYGIVDESRPTQWAAFGSTRPSDDRGTLVRELERVRAGSDSLYWTARPDGLVRLDESTWEPAALEEWERALMADSVEARPAATLDEVWARLGKEANERGWCSEYDQLARELGGPERPARMRTYTVYARVPVSVEMPEHADGPRAAIEAWVANDRRGAQRALAARITELAAGGQYSAVPILDPSNLADTL